MYGIVNKSPGERTSSLKDDVGNAKLSILFFSSTAKVCVGGGGLVADINLLLCLLGRTLSSISTY